MQRVQSSSASNHSIISDHVATSREDSKSSTTTCPYSYSCWSQQPPRPIAGAGLIFFEALGFQKVGGVESYPSVFLSDGSSLITLWQTDEGATPFNRRKNVGLHYVAIKVPSLEALNKADDVVSKVEGVRVDGEGARWNAFSHDSL